MEISGKIAVVTGAGGGMGRDLTLQLAAAGCHVAACDVSKSSVEGTAQLAEELPGKVSAHVVDVADEKQLQRLRDELCTQHDTEVLHLLFNNAGIGGGGSMIADPREMWERTFGIDWGGVYLGVRTFLPMMIASDQARIVNTSSVNGFWATLGPDVSHTAYSAAKFAVKGFTEALITDLRIHAPHVTCAVVMPGHIGTGIVANSRKVLVGTDSDELSAPEIAAARSLLGASQVNTESITDDDIQAMIADRARRFEEKAPTSSAQAATIILDGVRADKWRILVGEDAHKLDERVRREPEEAYEQHFYDWFVDQTGWSLGEQ